MCLRRFNGQLTKCAGKRGRGDTYTGKSKRHGRKKKALWVDSKADPSGAHPWRHSVLGSHPDFPSSVLGPRLANLAAIFENAPHGIGPQSDVQVEVATKAQLSKQALETAEQEREDEYLIPSSLYIHTTGTKLKGEKPLTCTNWIPVTNPRMAFWCLK